MNVRSLLRMMLLGILFAQYGCAGKIYVMQSQPSLSETSEFSSTEIYSLNKLTGDARDPLVVSGVEMYPVLRNSRLLRSYDISFVIPIPEDVEGQGQGATGEHPFIIFLNLRANGDGATFNTSASELYLEGYSEAVSPDKVMHVKHPKYTLYRDPPSRFMDVVEGEIPLLNKQTVTTDGGKEIKDWSIPHETNLQFRFDVPTPDPSEKFHLKLGEILTPSGESIRPTIYFSPVTYVNITH